MNKLIKDFLELNREQKVGDCVEDIYTLLNRHREIVIEDMTTFYQ